MEEQQSLDPESFTFLELDKEQILIVEELKKNTHRDVTYEPPTDVKEPTHKITFFIKKKDVFCVDLKEGSVTFQNKIFSKIKEIFNL
jgi:hypothetical protein